MDVALFMAKRHQELLTKESDARQVQTENKKPKKAPKQRKDRGKMRRNKERVGSLSVDQLEAARVTKVSVS